MFSNVSLSARNVTRRIEDLSFDLKLSLKKRATEFEFYSLALDKSTDAKDIVQLAVCVRGIDKDFHITEELDSLVGLQTTTIGIDIPTALQHVVEDLSLKLNNLCGITTDGAPAMTGKVNRAVALVEKARKNAGISTKLVKTHCIIHQEHLCGKSLMMRQVMDVVVKTVIFIRARALNHRQFQALLQEANAEYGDLLYYSEVR